MLFLWNRIKIVCGHHLPLEITIIGIFLSFSLNQGSIGDFMKACTVLFIFDFFTGNYNYKNLSRGHLTFLIVILFMLLLNFTVPGLSVHKRSLCYFLYFAGVVLAIDSLAVKFEKNGMGFFPYICAVSVIIAVTIQFIEYFINLGKGQYGLYHNMHHLGFFAILTIPILFYFFCSSRGFLRYLLILPLFMDFYLLWESSSRIAWLAFFAACFITFLLFFKIKDIIKLTVGLLLFSSLSLFIAGFSDVEKRFQDFASNWRQEERIILWKDTVKMLTDNSAKDWIVGHGIGTFRNHYPKYSTYCVPDTTTPYSFTFPHNTILQIIFENGLIGVILFFGLFFLLFFSFKKKSLNLQDQSTFYLLITTFCIFSAFFIFTFLTLPVYSRYTLCPAGLIIGLSLVMVKKTFNAQQINN